MLKIFITGTTGFIGKNLLDHFTDLNSKVFVYKRGSDIFRTMNDFKPDIIINCAGEIYNEDLMFNSNIENVYCLISDGECAEGIVWEALSFIKLNKINNLHVYVNMNGYGTFSKIDKKYLSKRLKSFLPTINIIKTNSKILNICDGLESHYHILNEREYNEFTSN